MTSFADNFNRADGAPGAGWVLVSGPWTIISQQLSSGAAGGTVVIRAATAMATSDHSAQITIAATTSASQGVWCRGDLTLDNGYVLRNNGSSWALFSVVAGAFTSIGTFAAAAAPGDVAKIQVAGSTITGWINGVSRISVTNTAVTTGTSVGLRADSTSALRFDDFTAADAATAVTGTATASFGGLTATASGVPKVVGSATAAFGGLTATASGVPKVIGTATAAFGGLTATAAGTRKVVGTAALTGGALTAAVSGVRTVLATATTQFGGLSATATSPSTVTGTATATFGRLTATASGHGPAAVEQGSWYGLLNILQEGAQMAREELERDPVACLDCGEPLRTGPQGVLYCPFDGSTWTAGNRRTGHISTAGR